MKIFIFVMQIKMQSYYSYDHHNILYHANSSYLKSRAMIVKISFKEKRDVIAQFFFPLVETWLRIFIELPKRTSWCFIL